MAIDPTKYYRTLTDMNAYFDERLHETSWSGASADDQAKAALAATRDVDSLDFSGYKKTVYDLLEANPDATAAEIETAYKAQPLQFPRDTQTVDTVPDLVFYACCEIAHERLSGRDPDVEFENLVLTSDGVGSTRVSSDRSQMPPEHLSHKIVSATAWKYLRPFLDDNNDFSVTRV